MNITEYCEKFMSNRERPIQRRVWDDVDFQEARSAVYIIGKHLEPAFSIDDYNRAEYSSILKWALGNKGELDPCKGLYLYGNTGTGKTMLVTIMRHISRYYGTGLVNECDVNVSYLIDKTARADEICDDYAETGDISQWVKYPSLCINDLGSEPAETVYMGNRRRVLRSILEQRADRADRMTIITSNFPPDSDDFVQMYGHRVRSRIQQMCNVVFLDGPDRRNN